MPACPVCGQDVPEYRLDTHVNRCLDTQARQEALQELRRIHSILPSEAFALASESVLVKQIQGKISRLRSNFFTLKDANIGGILYIVVDSCSSSVAGSVSIDVKIGSETRRLSPLSLGPGPQGTLIAQAACIPVGEYYSSLPLSFEAEFTPSAAGSSVSCCVPPARGVGRKGWWWAGGARRTAGGQRRSRDTFAGAARLPLGHTLGAASVQEQGRSPGSAAGGGFLVPQGGRTGFDLAYPYPYPHLHTRSALSQHAQPVCHGSVLHVHQPLVLGPTALGGEGVGVGVRLLQPASSTHAPTRQEEGIEGRPPSLRSSPWLCMRSHTLRIDCGSQAASPPASGGWLARTWAGLATPARQILRLGTLCGCSPLHACSEGGDKAAAFPPGATGGPSPSCEDEGPPVTTTLAVMLTLSIRAVYIPWADLSSAALCPSEGEGSPAVADAGVPPPPAVFRPPLGLGLGLGRSSREGTGTGIGWAKEVATHHGRPCTWLSPLHRAAAEDQAHLLASLLARTGPSHALTRTPPASLPAPLPPPPRARHTQGTQRHHQHRQVCLGNLTVLDVACLAGASSSVLYLLTGLPGGPQACLTPRLTGPHTRLHALHCAVLGGNTQVLYLLLRALLGKGLKPAEPGGAADPFAQAAGHARGVDLVVHGPGQGQGASGRGGVGDGGDSTPFTAADADARTGEDREGERGGMGADPSPIAPLTPSGTDPFGASGSGALTTALGRTGGVEAAGGGAVGALSEVKVLQMVRMLEGWIEESRRAGSAYSHPSPSSSGGDLISAADDVHGQGHGPWGTLVSPWRMAAAPPSRGPAAASEAASRPQQQQQQQQPRGGGREPSWSSWSALGRGGRASSGVVVGAGEEGGGEGAEGPQEDPLEASSGSTALERAARRLTRVVELARACSLLPPACPSGVTSQLSMLMASSQDSSRTAAASAVARTRRRLLDALREAESSAWSGPVFPSLPLTASVLNCPDAGGRSPLAMAALLHRHDMVGHLLRAGALTGHPDAQGLTPLLLCLGVGKLCAPPPAAAMQEHEHDERTAEREWWGGATGRGTPCWALGVGPSHLPLPVASGGTGLASSPPPLVQGPRMSLSPLDMLHDGEAYAVVDLSLSAEGIDTAWRIASARSHARITSPLYATAVLPLPWASALPSPTAALWSSPDRVPLTMEAVTVGGQEVEHAATGTTGAGAALRMNPLRVPGGHARADADAAVPAVSYPPITTSMYAVVTTLHWPAAAAGQAGEAPQPAPVTMTRKDVYPIVGTCAPLATVSLGSSSGSAATVSTLGALTMATCACLHARGRRGHGDHSRPDEGRAAPSPHERMLGLLRLWVDGGYPWSATDISRGCIYPADLLPMLEPPPPAAPALSWAGMSAAPSSRRGYVACSPWHMAAVAGDVHALRVLTCTEALPVYDALCCLESRDALRRMPPRWVAALAVCTAMATPGTLAAHTEEHKLLQAPMLEVDDVSAGKDGGRGTVWGRYGSLTVGRRVRSVLQARDGLGRTAGEAAQAVAAALPGHSADQTPFAQHVDACIALLQRLTWLAEWVEMRPGGASCSASMKEEAEGETEGQGEDV